MKTSTFKMNLLSSSLFLALTAPSYAAVVTVDGTSYSDTGNKSAFGIDNPVLLVMNGGDATWNIGNLMSSGSGAGSVVIESGSTLNLIDTVVGSIQANTPALKLSGGSIFNSTLSRITAFNNSNAVMMSEGSHMYGDNITISSGGVGLRVLDSLVDFTNLNIITTGTNGIGISASDNSDIQINGGSIVANHIGIGISSGSQLNLANGEIQLVADGAHGIFAEAARATLDDVKVHSIIGGVGLAALDGTNVTATKVDIDIAGGAGTNSGITLSEGSGSNIVSLEDSQVTISGDQSIAMSGGTSGLQTITLKNSKVTGENIAIKANDSVIFAVTADGSSIEGATLLAGGASTPTASRVVDVSLTASNSSQLKGDVVIDHDYTLNSYLRLDSRSTWKGASSGLHNLELRDGSRWTMSGDSDITNLTLDSSNIYFNHADSGFKTLRVEGDFAGNNGTLVMNSVLGGDDSDHDKLIVMGNTTGSTNVIVNQVGGSGASTLQGIELIAVNGDSSGEFVQQGRIVAGAYDYRLQRGNGSAEKNWYLTSELPPVIPDPEIAKPAPIDPGFEHDGGTPEGPLPAMEMTFRPEVGNYIANIAAANTLFNLSLKDRAEGTYYTDPLNGERKVTSLWMRNLGGHRQMRDSSGQLKTQTNRYVLQLGGDIVSGTTNDIDSLRVGAMAGYGNARSSTVSDVTQYRSKGHTTGYNLGIYGTWYQQAEQQTGGWVDSWLQYSWFNNSVNGDQLAAERYKSIGFTASMQTGYSWRMGEDSFKNRYFIEPNAQFIWMGVKAEDLEETNGTRISSQGYGNIQSRLGIRASLKTEAQDNKAVITPYVETRWINNSKSFGSSLNGVTVNGQGTKNIGEVRVGIDSKLKSDINIWGHIGQQAGSHQYRDTSAAIGVKVSF